MNILLVNFFLKANHGGILQCYALQKVLQDMGHTAVKAEPPRRILPKNKILLLKTIIRKIWLHYIRRQKNIDVFSEIKSHMFRNIIDNNAHKFIRKHLKIIKTDDFSNLKGSDYDAVIVGSDQLWRKSYINIYPFTDKTPGDNMFLAFTRNWNCRRIAYAVSFGLDYWEYTPKETEKLKDLIHNFNAVSVREDSGVQLIHDNLGEDINVCHVLDPALLLTKEDYVNLYKKTSLPEKKGKILCYILDFNRTKQEIIDTVKEKTSEEVFFANNIDYEKPWLPWKKAAQTSIESWLKGFNDAKYVVADSFHASVFSIIFEKEFIVIANKQRGIARIDSLLRMFNLENRIVFQKDDIQNISSTIDWQSVREILQRERKKSMSFLSSALKNTED